MSNEASKYTKSATVERAREMLKRLHDRNQRTWDDLDRDVAFAIKALIASAERYRFIAHGMQAEQAQPVAWRWKERINGDFDSWVISVSEPPPYATEKPPLYTSPPQRQRLEEWQPIETAPKTGRKVILFYLNRNKLPRTVMARWLTDEQAAESDGDGVGLEGGWYECIDNWDDYTEVAIHEGEPSHWMPLPAPPIEAAHGIRSNDAA